MNANGAVLPTEMLFCSFAFSLTLMCSKTGARELSPAIPWRRGRARVVRAAEDQAEGSRLFYSLACSVLAGRGMSLGTPAHDGDDHFE